MQDKLQIETIPFYTSYKVGHYFQQKSYAPPSLRAVVAYQSKLMLTRCERDLHSYLLATFVY